MTLSIGVTAFATHTLDIQILESDDPVPSLATRHSFLSPGKASGILPSLPHAPSTSEAMT